MALLVFIYVAAAVFVIGNLYRLLRIARMPAHVRWELYPMPRGTREQQRYGGSYFEHTEWWTKRRPSSSTSELGYIAREVLTFKTLRHRNRPLWLWSWLMHVGLYTLIVASAGVFIAATRGRLPHALIQILAMLSSCVGLAGVAGLVARRLGSHPMRAGTARRYFLNLFLIGALFVSGAAAYGSPNGTQELVSFTRAFLRVHPTSTMGWPATAHCALLGLFLAYFPATHMTHAYMKFFTYHRVRWDDEPVAHNVAIERSMSANVRRPISWAAPHIASTDKSTWADAVTRSRP